MNGVRDARSFAFSHVRRVWGWLYRIESEDLGQEIELVCCEKIRFYSLVEFGRYLDCVLWRFAVEAGYRKVFSDPKARSGRRWIGSMSLEEALLFDEADFDDTDFGGNNNRVGLARRRETDWFARPDHLDVVLWRARLGRFDSILFEMKWVLGFLDGEMAEMLGVDRGVVSHRLFSLKRNIRRYMGRISPAGPLGRGRVDIANGLGSAGEVCPVS